MVLLGLGAGSVVYYQKQKVNVEAPASQTIQSKATTTEQQASQEDATKDWKMYKNDYLGFGLKYPENELIQTFTLSNLNAAFGITISEEFLRYLIRPVKEAVLDITYQEALMSDLENKINEYQNKDYIQLISKDMIRADNQDGIKFVFSEDFKLNIGTKAKYLAMQYLIKTKAFKGITLSNNKNGVLGITLWIANPDAAKINKYSEIVNKIVESVSFFEATSSVNTLSGDPKRISDLGSIYSSVSLYLATASNPFLCTDNKTVYASKNIFVPSGWRAGAHMSSTAIDGTGWIPVDFTKIPGGSPLSKLPVDANHFYLFVCDPQTKTFELDSIMEKYFYLQPGDKTSTDGGDDPEIYELGTNLHLIPKGFWDLVKTR